MTEEKILVTGGAGFIGSLLVRELLLKGYRVRLMDIFNFGFDSLRDIMPNKNLELFPGDIRKSEDVNRGLENVDTVIHLAAIVGDPACAIQADNAVETNYLSTLRLAMAAKEKDINKFIFSSTCSVYGAGDKILTETSELNPQSLYAETKIYAEKGIMDLSNTEFNPIILRLSTLYGLSPRPRFDLVINYLTGKLIVENKCLIFGGEQWRPFLHVADVANAFVFSYENYNRMKNRTYNVGGNDENYQMKDVGKTFEEIFPNADIQYVNEIKDPRSYNVNFDEIEKLGYKVTKNIKTSIVEIKEFIEDNKIDPNSPQYYNYHP
jgi:nucleoside-diphosphate-sugar epimerase